MVKNSKGADRRAASKKERNREESYSLSRYVLTGAALGLYFGLFFRPAREPTLVLVLGLSLISAVAVTLLQLRHPDTRQARALLRYFLKAWGGFAAVLAMLEARHFFYDLGGRLPTALFTTLYGAGLGYLYEKAGRQEAR